MALFFGDCRNCGSVRYSPPRTECDDQQTIASAVVYFSISDPCKVDGLRIKNDDIVAYDGQRFARLFHGADVGLKDLEIDGFAILSEAELLFSFSKPFVIDSEHPLPGLIGEIDDSDVILFTANSLGEVTRGTFSVYLNGASIGLDDDEEDIDALAIDAEGRLLFSTVGNTKLPARDGSEINVRDEDVVAIIRSDKAEGTTFELALDSSDLALDSFGTDLDALAWSQEKQLLISMRDVGEGGQTVSAGRGGEVLQVDIEKFGSRTQGKVLEKIFLEGRSIGLEKSDISSLEIGPALRRSESYK